MQFDLIKSLGDGDNQIDYGFVFGGDRQKILLIKGVGSRWFARPLHHLTLARWRNSPKW